MCKFLYTGKSGDHSIPQLIVNDDVIVNDVEKAEAFNDYFCSISKVEETDANIPEAVVPTDYELSNIIISDQDVIDVLQNLKVNKACGFDMTSKRIC